MAEKKVFWLKLKGDFFNSLRIKKLRRLAGGDTYTIIYLKMQLVAMKHDGYLQYTGLEDSFADELALELDENPDDVKVTLAYMLNCGLAEASSDNLYFLPYSVENSTSESASAERVRKCRDKQKALHCNADETNCNAVETNCNTDIEIDIEKDIDIEQEREKDVPTLAEIRKYCEERKNNVDAVRFYDYYSMRKWQINGSSIDWKAAVRSWESNKYAPPKPKNEYSCKNSILNRLKEGG